jgi:hypothetical protein
MAEPLTSSDIIRERMGFGVSPLASEDTRRAYAAAGLSPLGTQDRQRLAEGRGISPMAGKSEKEAFVAAEVQAGLRPESDLPEEYGGRPQVTVGPRFDDRGQPTGTFRRQLRMQEMWDAERNRMVEEQKFAQQLESEQKRLTLSERNQTLQDRQEARLQAAEAKAQDLVSRVSDDADRAMNELLGGVDESGNPTIGLDPDDPNYIQRRNDLIKRYPKAPKDEAFKLAIETTDKSYFDSLNFNQQLKAQEESSGRIIERQIAAEERAAEKQTGIREEERVAQEERGIVSQEREIDKQIRAQRQVLAGLQGRKPTRTLEKASTEARNKLLDLRIERSALRGLVFETEEEANAANPPSGSTIYINRKPFKVP